MTQRFSRRGLLSLPASLAVPVAIASASHAVASTLTLTTRPTRVFKVADLARENTEAWFVTVVAVTSEDRRLAPEHVSLSYFSGAVETASAESWGAALSAMTFALPPANGQFRPFGLRLISRQPVAAAIDRMRVSVEFLDTPSATVDVAIGVYQQRTALVFPFRGAGFVTQASAANGGHRNASGQFAIDAMGLSERYALQTGRGFARNRDLEGFGRELISPAAGAIVIARGDRPDQPVPGESNEEFHAPELRGAGDPGNHVVIDHGNGEFSMIAHLRSGSLAVREGDRVVQGQRIGELGNSGDSFAPHVHHQLQDGPDWQTANGLPHNYSNIDSRLDRGAFFDAS